jgi:hypothetical protein
MEQARRAGEGVGTWSWSRDLNSPGSLMTDYPEARNERLSYIPGFNVKKEKEKEKERVKHAEMERRALLI